MYGPAMLRVFRNAHQSVPIQIAGPYNGCTIRYRLCESTTVDVGAERYRPSTSVLCMWDFSAHRKHRTVMALHDRVMTSWKGFRL